MLLKQAIEFVESRVGKGECRVLCHGPPIRSSEYSTIIIAPRGRTLYGKQLHNSAWYTLPKLMGNHRIEVVGWPENRNWLGLFFDLDKYVYIGSGVEKVFDLRSAVLSRSYLDMMYTLTWDGYARALLTELAVYGKITGDQVFTDAGEPSIFYSVLELAPYPDRTSATDLVRFTTALTADS